MYHFTACEMNKVLRFLKKLNSIVQKTAFNYLKKSILVKREVRLEKY